MRGSATRGARPGRWSDMGDRSCSAKSLELACGRNRLHRIPASGRPAGLISLFVALCTLAVGCASERSGDLRMVRDSIVGTLGEINPAGFGEVDVLAVVGREEGAGLDLFGRLAGAALLPGGHIVALDDRLQRLVLLDSTATPLNRVGRPGQGPGEFVQPVRLLPRGDHEVVLLDRGAMRITGYAVVSDSLAILEETPIPYFADDFCFLDDEIYLLTGRGSGIVEVLDATRSLVRAFGTSPTFEDIQSPVLREAAQTTVAGGRIACDPVNRQIVVVLKFLPEIRAYSPEGGLLWEVAISDHLALTVVPTRDGQGTTFATDDPSGVHHRAMTAVISGPELIVQLAVLDWVHRDPGAREVDTRVLRLRDGVELRRTLDWPLVGAVSDGLAVAYVNAPFPRLALTSSGWLEPADRGER